MKTVEALEAESRFGELLAEVADGATVVITQEGTPVARLEPIREPRADAATIIREWERFRDEHNVVLGGDISIRELIEEGRR